LGHFIYPAQKPWEDEFVNRPAAARLRKKRPLLYGHFWPQKGQYWPRKHLWLEVFSINIKMLQRPDQGKAVN